MRVACCQFDIAWEDKPANYARVGQLVGGAKLQRGTLLLLPEMFATGFSMNAAAIAETQGGPTARFIADLARGHGIYVLAGIVLGERGEQARNEAVLFDPSGNLACRYAKLHRFSFAGEDRHYAAGAAPAKCVVEGCTVQPAVCYDLRFPELFRTPATRGAELICVIANWPAARDAHWVALLKARAIENQAHVAAVNRCGRDANVEYSGHSQIVGPWGEVLEDAGSGEAVIHAELDLSRLREYRAKFPALNDIRL
jgi:omega-amidase